MPALPAKAIRSPRSLRNPITVCNSVIAKPAQLAFLLIVTLCLVVGCSTRQLSDSVPGSTAQRLVTYSLEKFIRDMMGQTELNPIRQKKVSLNVHFLEGHTLLDYATQLLSYELESRFQVELTDPDSATYELDIFFNSMGTDYDSYGLSLPGFGLAATPDSRINILSIDMFHGVTEGYALIKNTENGKTDKTQRLLARIRADNVATPILDFPVNQLD